MEKNMANHSSTLAWKIPRRERPGRLQSMGSRRVRHDSETSLSLFIFMHWRKKWQPTPVFLPRESQGQRSLVGCHLWGRRESNMTEATYQQQQMMMIIILQIILYYKFQWSEVIQSCPTRCDPMASSLHQPPPSMGFSRQEYWSGLPFPSPANLPNPGIKPQSPTL